MEFLFPCSIKSLQPVHIPVKDAMVPLEGSNSVSDLVLSTGAESNANVCYNTEIRHLPSWARAKLGQLVEDKTGQWLALMAAIPASPPWSPGMCLPPQHLQYSRKYTPHECRCVGRRAASISIILCSSLLYLYKFLYF